MNTRGRSRRLRLTALALLGALAFAFAPTSAAAQLRAHCLPPVSGSAITMAMPGDCGHAGDPACASLPGCAAPVPALATAPFAVAIVSDVARLTPASPVTLPGRLRAGPPTPPPNS